MGKLDRLNCTANVPCAHGEGHGRERQTTALWRGGAPAPSNGNDVGGAADLDLVRREDRHPRAALHEADVLLRLLGVNEVYEGELREVWQRGEGEPPSPGVSGAKEPAGLALTARIHRRDGI